MTDHNGVLMMQRVLLAGTLGMAMAQKAAEILEGKPAAAQRPQSGEGPYRGDGPQSGERPYSGDGPPTGDGPQSGEGARDEEVGPGFREPEGTEGAVLRAILDAANECLGHFDDRPAGERWCDTLFHLLDLAAFAAELSGRS